MLRSYMKVDGCGPAGYYDHGCETTERFFLGCVPCVGSERSVC